MDLGSAAEWFAGVATAATALIAVRVAALATRIAGDERRAAVRERLAGRLLDLVRAVEADIARGQTDGRPVSSPEAVALCSSLWGHRNWFGTVWHFYCEEDRRWIGDLAERGELVPRMRHELHEALHKLDWEDAQPETAKPPLVDRLLRRLGLQRLRLP